jgi:hypothetical protein
MDWASFWAIFSQTHLLARHNNPPQHVKYTRKDTPTMLALALSFCFDNFYVQNTAS